jgi:hypothetical protein
MKRMERIYVADDPIFIGYLKSLLEAAAIDCMVRNELLIGASGELPPNECWPELWVLHETDAAAAHAIVKNVLEVPAVDGNAWICSHCAESCEPQFGACWRCGSLRRD